MRRSNWLFATGGRTKRVPISDYGSGGSSGPYFEILNFKVMMNVKKFHV